MQTIRVPYSADTQSREILAELRRVQSSAIRTAYANAAYHDPSRNVDDQWVFHPEKDVRRLIKDRFGTVVLDSWALHCATRDGIVKRRLVPDGTMIFGGRKHLLRRNDGLIDRDKWRDMRLMPFVSYGDSQKTCGNQNVKLHDHRTVVVRIARKENGRKGRTTVSTATLHLAAMKGRVGEIMRQLATICAKDEGKERINVTFSIDERAVSVTFDPMLLPQHPERRAPVKALPGRTLGIDLNPEWIGVAAVSNTGDPTRLEDTVLLDHLLIEPDLPRSASIESIRHSLAVVCDRVIGMARKHRAGTIVVEKGLGKLRSRRRGRALNALINFWCRTVLIAMLRRKAKLAGIQVVEVWGGYSTTIGNLAFAAPDACAAAAEIARRGLAVMGKKKELLPAMVREVCPGLWKDQDVPNAVREALQRASSWSTAHRAIKTVKIGFRRPHPARDSEPQVSTPGYAVHRLGLKHHPGWIFRPAPVLHSEAVA